MLVSFLDSKNNLELIKIYKKKNKQILKIVINVYLMIFKNFFIGYFDDYLGLKERHYNIQIPTYSDQTARS